MYMSYQIRTDSVPILPEGAADIRVLHLSDLHLTPKRKVEIADIKSCINFNPDLVIVTGDFLASATAVPTVIEALGALLDLPGLFVFGSNDYNAPQFKNPFSYLLKDDGIRKLGKELPWQLLATELCARGWIDLNHQRTMITVKGTTIEARGTDDAHVSRDKYGEVAGEPNPKADLAIGVTHAPYLRILEAMSEDQLDIIFAGHTHGGQVRLPFPGGSKALTTNCDLPTWRARGLTKIQNEPWLNVSAGMGTSPFARIRVASPPEVSIITLEPAF
jgi:predicted MPP superfamily phosphohydrolase